MAAWHSPAAIVLIGRFVDKTRLFIDTRLYTCNRSGLSYVLAHISGIYLKT